MTKKLRSSSKNMSVATPIIALTANARSCDAEACINAGMNDYMTKPLIFNNLIEKLQVFLDVEKRVPHA